MHRTLSILSGGVFCCAVIWGCGGCGKRPSAAQGQGGPPTGQKSGGIKFVTLEKDFGLVPKGPPAKYDFEFENVGPGDLTMYQPQSSCGCTAALVSTQKVPVHGKGKVEVTFNTHGPGRFEKTVRVVSSDQDVTLTIRGQVMDLVMWDPSSLDFGQQMVGTTLTKEATITLAPKVEKVTMGPVPDAYQAELTPTADASRYRLKVTLKAGAPAGPLGGGVRLIPTWKESLMPEDAAGEYTVPVSASVVQFQVTPAKLNFGDVDLGRQASQTVKLHPAPGVTLDKIDLHAASDRVLVKANPMAGSKDWQVVVSVNPRGELGPFRESVWLTAHDPQGKKLQGNSIDIEGHLRADFDIYPKRIFLGSAAPGSKRVKQIKLMASSELVPTLKMIGTDQVKAELKGSGQEREIRLTWNPQGAGGRVIGFLEVTINGKAATVPVHGYVLGQTLAAVNP